MKKFKLMLVAIMAFVGINAWGAALKNTYIETNTGVKYKITKIKKADADYQVTVSQSDYAAKGLAALSIPKTISWSVNGEDEDGTAINEEITFKVVEIEANAFKDVTKITSLTIADENIGVIGNSAFEGCTGLTTATIGSAVYSIGNDVFKGATSLETITFNAYAATVAHPTQAFGTGIFAGTIIKTLNLTPTKLAAVQAWFGAAGNETLTTVKFPSTLASIATKAFEDCSNLAVVTFTAPADDAPAQTIGARAFAGTIISDLNLTNTNIQVLNQLFEDVNADLASVTLPASLVTIEESAFETCAKLSSVDLTKCTKLTTIKDYAFGTTPSLKSLDFSKCEKLVYFTDDGLVKGGNNYVNPFISAGKTNKQLTSITLNAVEGKETADIGTALAGLSVLATHNIDKTKITLLAAGALNGTAKITALTLPASVATIAEGALQGSSVAELTINSNTTAATPTIGAGTGSIYGTSTAVLTDLTFVGEFKGTIEGKAFEGNTALANVTFGDVSGTIEADAFGAGATNVLTSVELGEIKTGASIEGGAFDLADAASTVTITKVSADAFGASAFTGPATATNKVALEIGNVNIAMTKKLVSANVGVATIGDVNVNFPAVNILGDAEEIDFTKAFATGVTITAASANAASLKKVVFGTEETGIALAANSIKKGAFLNATGLKIYWMPAVATKAFDDDFIKTAAAGTTYGTDEESTTMNNFLYTNTIVGEAYYGTPFTNNAEKLYDVYFVAATTAAETVEIEPQNNGTGKYYYAKLFNATGAYQIAKEQNGATVVVYGAYVDQSDNVVYFDQLRVIEGYYNVPANSPVIIKTNKEGKIQATGYTGGTFSMQTYGGKVSNEIFATTTALVGYTLKEKNPDTFNGYTFNNTNYGIYALAKIEKYNIQWKPFGDATKLPAGTFYVHGKPEAAGARGMRVVWLDGSEEDDNATAIQTIENEAENDGAVYNLQGVRVNAAYKGVVIKNGKKIFQK